MNFYRRRKAWTIYANKLSDGWTYHGQFIVQSLGYRITIVCIWTIVNLLSTFFTIICSLHEQLLKKQMGGYCLTDSVIYWSYVGLRLQEEYSKFVQYFVNTFYFYICQYVCICIYFLLCTFWEISSKY